MNLDQPAHRTTTTTKKNIFKKEERKKHDRITSSTSVKSYGFYFYRGDVRLYTHNIGRYNQTITVYIQHSPSPFVSFLCFPLFILPLLNRTDASLFLNWYYSIYSLRKEFTCVIGAHHVKENEKIIGETKEKIDRKLIYIFFSAKFFKVLTICVRLVNVWHVELIITNRWKPRILFCYTLFPTVFVILDGTILSCLGRRQTRGFSYGFLYYMYSRELRV